MNELKRGEFFGAHYQKLNFEDFTITDTEYTHNKVDWHFHENPYFTYLLQGKLYEANKKEEYYLESGSLLFHNWQDAHHNIKPKDYTRGFHIEFNSDWFLKHDIALMDFEGSLNLKNPVIKSLMNKVFLETKINDNQSQLSIELLMIAIFNKMKTHESIVSTKTPEWVKKTQEILLETDVNYTLEMLSKELNIHSVHLSREFHRYFGTTFGQYVRQLKLNKAITLIASNQLSMTEICYKCGFYDQSHFISCFKQIYKVSPSSFNKNFKNVKNIQL
ncbi:helix-turn-helix domain-containing protein [Flavobacterium sp.]|uniref:helix-turn-helix domain-containing protein n=1 Tax=Flavobacterium sp. TaxID=239 RepID=UPI004048A2AD